MPLTIINPKYRRDPNEKIDSLYYGVAPGGLGMVTRMIKPARDGSKMEVSQTRTGNVMPRGQGGLAGILILGGMETTLDEMEDIMQARKEKKFVPRRGPGEIADMCRHLIERRNEAVLHMRKNPSERQNFAPKKTVRLHLPVGCRMVQTPVRGMKVLAQI